jgi:hypothetical protein
MIGTPAAAPLPAAAKAPRRLCPQTNSHRHSITSSARTSNAVGIPYPEGLRGLEIEHQLELRRLLHRQIGGLFTFENPAHITPTDPTQSGATAEVTRRTKHGRKPDRRSAHAGSRLKLNDAWEGPV